jgi:NADH-quinone oxidoreductase subunit L
LSPSDLIHTGSLVLFAAPAVLFVLLAAPTLVGKPLSERVTSLLVSTTFSLSTVAFLIVVVTMALHDLTQVTVPVGIWYSSGSHASEIGLLVDRLSLTFAGLTALLCGVTTAFSTRYLHRETGYNRFFILVALFAAGLQLITLGDSIQLTIVGWECVGLSSAFLIGFFHERPAPVQNAYRAFVIYHATDIGLLCAGGYLYHLVGTGRYAEIVGATWPLGASNLHPEAATIVLLLVLLSVAGKSALFPFSGWLPRAMEGPTPSSAIYYGALSVHAGAYLLLRMGPLLDRSPMASAAVTVLGIVTALHATLVGRVQTDIKSALAYATLTQVGLIIAEIGLGFRWLPLFHISGHACVRSLQFLRAPNLLHDHHRIGNAAGVRRRQTGWHLEKLFPKGVQTRLYRYAIERGNLDGWLNALVVRPFKTVFVSLERLDSSWCGWIGGTRKPGSQVEPGVRESSGVEEDP